MTPKRILGSRNLAVFERWVTVYSLRVLPVIWVTALIVAFLASALLTHSPLRDHVVTVASDTAILALALWMLGTGLGVAWLITRSFFDKGADRGLAVNLWRSLLLLTGVLFLVLGIVLSRAIAPQLVRALLH